MATRPAVRSQASTSSSSAIISNRFGGTSSRPFHRCRRMSSPARAKNTSRRFGASRTGTWTALSRCEARSRRAAAPGVGPRREKKTAPEPLRGAESPSNRAGGGAPARKENSPEPLRGAESPSNRAGGGAPARKENSPEPLRGAESPSNRAGGGAPARKEKR